MAIGPLNVMPKRDIPGVLPEPLAVLLPQHRNGVSTENGVRKTELDDGGIVIDFSPKSDAVRSTRFDANLAIGMDDIELAKISSELMRGYRTDVDSRQEQLETLAEGIKLLGLTIENTQSSPASTSATGIEGQHKTTHPLLLDACLLFQANARGQLLPASGPVKIRDDRPTQPPAPPMAPPGPPGGMGPMPPVPPGPLAAGPMPAPGAPHPMMPPPGGPQTGPMHVPPSVGPAGGMPMSSPMAGIPPIPPLPPPVDRDNLSAALEKDLNHYLTVTASEYIPDTDQMFFKTGFGGLGIKKVYNCPIRRRPVSESVNIEDLVVSNALTNLANAGRITHVVKMRPSTLKRLQLLKFYRDIHIGQPTQSDAPTAVEQAKADIAGVQPQVTDPKDADHVVLEMLCELELDEFAPQHFKGKGLPLPYRVTIEKDSQKILEIRRNWREDDKQCLAKEYYVEYVFVRAFGFYGLGLLHILGNTTKTLTAAWREFIDSGMFANFPGFLYAKGAGRQLTNSFRVAPGTGVGLDVGLQRLSDAVMPLPYKDLGPAFTSFIQHVEELGQRLGGTAQIEVGEGRGDTPVGTTLALIEQATKATGAVMKRLWSAQAKEFQLLKERFKEDPEAFWRFNKKPTLPWQKDQFLQALNDCDLVPVADPNNPTSLHRAAKSQWLENIALQAPGLLNPQKVFVRAAKYLEIGDAEDLLAPPTPPQGPPPDPAKMADLQMKGQAMQQKSQLEMQKAGLQAQQAQLQFGDSAAERQSREKIAQIGYATERLRLASTLAIHGDKAEQSQRDLQFKTMCDELSQNREHFNEMMMGEAQRSHDAQEAERQRQHELDLQAREPKPPSAGGQT